MASHLHNSIDKLFLDNDSEHSDSRPLSWTDPNSTNQGFAPGLFGGLPSETNTHFNGLHHEYTSYDNAFSNFSQAASNSIPLNQHNSNVSQMNRDPRQSRQYPRNTHRNTSGLHELPIRSARQVAVAESLLSPEQHHNDLNDRKGNNRRNRQRPQPNENQEKSRQTNVRSYESSKFENNKLNSKQNANDTRRMVVLQRDSSSGIGHSFNGSSRYNRQQTYATGTTKQLKNNNSDKPLIRCTRSAAASNKVISVYVKPDSSMMQKNGRNRGRNNCGVVGMYRSGVLNPTWVLCFKSLRQRGDYLHTDVTMPKKAGSYEFRLYKDTSWMPAKGSEEAHDKSYIPDPDVLSNICPIRVLRPMNTLAQYLSTMNSQIQEASLGIVSDKAIDVVYDFMDHHVETVTESLDTMIQPGIDRLASLDKINQFVEVIEEENSPCHYRLQKVIGLYIPWVCRQHVIRVMNMISNIRQALVEVDVCRREENSALSEDEATELSAALRATAIACFDVCQVVDDVAGIHKDSHPLAMKLFSAIRKWFAEMDDQESTITEIARESNTLLFAERLGYLPQLWIETQRSAIATASKSVLDEILQNDFLKALLQPETLEKVSMWASSFDLLSERFVEVDEKEQSSVKSNLRRNRMPAQVTNAICETLNRYMAQTHGLLGAPDQLEEEEEGENDDETDNNEIEQDESVVNETKTKNSNRPRAASIMQSIPDARSFEQFSFVTEKTLIPPHKLPKRVIRLADAIMKTMYSRLKPSSSIEPLRQALRKHVRVALQDMPIFKTGKLPLELDVFGSSGNGFGSDSADVDMVLTSVLLRGDKTARRHRLLPDFDGPSDTYGFPLHNHTDDTLPTRAELITEAATYLEQAGMINVTTRPTARVPIVTFTDPQTGLQCDLCACNTLALRNTKLLKTYCEMNPLVQAFVYPLKALLSARMLNNARVHTIPSYGWIVMVIAFLQRRPRPVVPCLQALPQEWDGKHLSRMSDTSNDLLPGIPAERTVHHGNVCKPQPSAKVPVEHADGKVLEGYFYDGNHMDEIKNLCMQNTESPGELLLNFLWYYVFQFDSRRHVVSIRPIPDATKLLDTMHHTSDEIDSEVYVRYDLHNESADGTPHPEVRKDWHSQISNWTGPQTLSIEDPFETFYNISHMLRTKPHQRVMKELMRAYCIIVYAGMTNRVPHLDDIVERTTSQDIIRPSNSLGIDINNSATYQGFVRDVIDVLYMPLGGWMKQSDENGNIET